jgi:hypothetical protein
MSALGLRGQSLSVLISALYLTEGGATPELCVAHNDVRQRQILLQGSDGLSSLMWKTITPLLTAEWNAFRVSSGGVTDRSSGRVALLDSAQALIELQARTSVTIVETEDGPGDSALWLPRLEDLRLDAKIVDAEGIFQLDEPVVVEINPDDPPGSYAQYVPLGGHQTMFTRHGNPTIANGTSPLEAARQVLGRLGELERFLLERL